MRQNEANQDVRKAAQKAGVYLWRIADGLGITDKTLCLWMRHEMPDELKCRCMAIIKKLADH